MQAVDSLSSGANFEATREMGCTAEDLLRWFPKALGAQYQQTSLVIDGQEILYGEPPLILMQGLTLKSRKIALLLIPVLELKITFDSSFSAEQIESILSRFDLYTQRGGG